MPDPDDVAALVAHLQALEDPMQEAMPSFADVDWRTLAGRCARVISALEKDAARWQPIETADSNTLALLYAPPEALFAEPAKHLGEFRVAAPRNWTWATHWMPLPAPPVDAAIAASDPQKGGA